MRCSYAAPVNGTVSHCTNGRPTRLMLELISSNRLGPKSGGGDVKLRYPLVPPVLTGNKVSSA